MLCSPLLISGVLALGGFQALRTGSDDDDPPRADSVMPARRREEPSRCLSGFPPAQDTKRAGKP